MEENLSSVDWLIWAARDTQLWSPEDQELKTIEDEEALLRELGMSEPVIDAQLTGPDRPG